ncbi:hypothetical protein H8L32_14780 [Undibacterium sp. CY18W]|uniref:DUF2486 family protein n=1 Tax=Undibacterium hunanense TaxID=2762292 RepID=A0ABR6ZSC4_9BURK|nr:hypothetical protein [Undibacterium hunanense]MBC3918757.1 hypothetical protein [Undibacterium hunanense]
MNNQIDASIPVLTEVILPEEIAAAKEPVSVPAAPETPSVTTNNVTDDRSEEDWQALEQTLHENVLRQVLARIDFVLEHRVRDSLADVLQIAVENLAGEIRTGLHKTLEEVITRAITQEISKVKSSK